MRSITDLDMWEFLGIDKALQSIQGEPLNNTSKLTEINKRIKKDTKKLKQGENDHTFSDEQRQLYKNRLDDLNTEKQARLEILSQKRKDLQTQVARIKQILEKVLDKNSSLYLISWTGYNHICNTDCPFDDHLNNSTCYYRCLWRIASSCSTSDWTCLFEMSLMSLNCIIYFWGVCLLIALLPLLSSRYPITPGTSMPTRHSPRPETCTEYTFFSLKTKLIYNWTFNWKNHLISFWSKNFFCIQSPDTKRPIFMLTHIATFPSVFLVFRGTPIPPSWWMLSNRR